MNFLDSIGNNKKSVGVIVIGIILVCLIGFIIYGVYQVNSNVIINGVHAGEVDLSKLSEEEARDKLEKLMVERQNTNLNLKSIKKTYVIPAKDLGYELDIDTIVEKALNYGRDESEVKNIFTAIGALFSKPNIGLENRVNKSAVNRLVRKLQENIYRLPREASVKVENSRTGKVSIVSEKPGISLDSKKARELLYKLDMENVDIQLPVDTISSDISEKDLAHINQVLGTYSTDYSTSEQNRKDNIALGAELTSHKLIKPGEEFSFLETIGSIEEENGWKYSGVIRDGQFERGIGGGICQVSTTLYNALVRADLEITERHNHSRPIGYVENGTDAAVSEPTKNLKFKNNYDSSVYIIAETDGDEITYTVYGDGSKKDYEIELEPELLGSYDFATKVKPTTSLPTGVTKVEKHGGYGYSYRTWKITLKNGKEVKRELFNESYYVPADKVILQGV